MKGLVLYVRVGIVNVFVNISLNVSNVRELIQAAVSNERELIQAAVSNEREPIQAAVSNVREPIQAAVSNEREPIQAAVSNVREPIQAAVFIIFIFSFCLVPHILNNRWSHLFFASLKWNRCTPQELQDNRWVSDSWILSCSGAD